MRQSGHRRQAGFNITIKATDKWGNAEVLPYGPSGEVEYIKRDTSSSIWMETVLINKAGQYNIVVENLLEIKDTLIHSH